MNSIDKEILELEQRKLSLEVSDMEKPYWKRITFIAATIPSMLAALTLFIGFYTGFFENKKTLLEIEKKELAASVEKLGIEQKELKAAKTELLSTKQGLLNEMRELKERLALGEVGVHIDSIKSAGDKLGPYHDSMEILLSLLSSSDKEKVKSAIFNEIKNSTNLVYLANLYFLIYKSERSDEYKKKIFLLLRNYGEELASAGSENGFWKIFGLYQWFEEDLVEVAEALSDVLSSSNFNEFTRDQLLGGLSRLGNTKDLASKFTNIDAYNKLIDTAKKQILNSNLEWYSRSNSIVGLVALSPKTAVIVAGTLLSDSTLDLTLRARIYKAIGDGEIITKARLDLRSPGSDNVKEWEVWINLPEIRELIQ
jgi:hypothetical protein